MPQARSVPTGELLVGIPVALVAGVAIGVLTTFKHQAGVSLELGTGFPYGLVLSLLLVAAFLFSVRILLETRMFTAVAGLGLVAADWLLAQRGPGGSVIVDSAAPVSIVWLIAPAIIAAAAVLVPIRRRPEPGDGDGILGSGAGDQMGEPS